MQTQIGLYITGSLTISGSENTSSAGYIWHKNPYLIFSVTSGSSQVIIKKCYGVCKSNITP